MKKKYLIVVGLCLSVTIPIIILLTLFDGIPFSLNHTYFASGGDGLKNYYISYYHIKQDSTFFRSCAMNYPYGESIFFTDSQPPVTNSVKLLSIIFPGISDYIVGFVNSLLLISIVIASLFIYLIFIHLGLPIRIALPASVFISFMSPQIDRFGGHFSLGYVCAVPIMIYLILIYSDKKSILVSLLISVMVLWGAMTHLYYYGFFGFLLLIYWLYEFYRHHSSGIRRKLGHFFLQLILPLIIFQLMIVFDSVTDRTTNPWGFLHYRAYLESVLLPLNKSYGRILFNLSDFHYIDWEGYAYVGLVASIGFLIFIYCFVVKLIRRRWKDIFRLTDNDQLNILYWSSLFALLYSFGVPFIFGLEFMLDYLGPIKQMRGIARFSWLFYYMMNIIVVYSIWKFEKKKRSKIIKYVLVFIVLITMGFDSWTNIKGKGKWLNNKIEVLEDKDNILDENKWINNINIVDYQAIIPIPYFHVGSENIWISPDGNIYKSTIIASQKTLLPTTGVRLSRTSIRQTFKSLGLMLEPVKIPEILGEFPNRKNFLIIADNNANINSNEKNIIKEATLIDSLSEYSVYRLEFQNLEKIFESSYAKVLADFNSTESQIIEKFNTEIKGNNLYYNSFEETNNGISFLGKNCFEGKAKKLNLIFNGSIYNCDTSKTYKVGFWIGNILSDLYPRTNVEFKFYNSKGDLYHIERTKVNRQLKCIDNGWALFEYDIKLENPNDILKIGLSNKNLKNQPLYIDDLLIFQEGEKYFMRFKNGIWKNNRYYHNDSGI